MDVAVVVPGAAMTESEKDAQARWIIKQDQPVCVCAPTNPKHREGWQCITREQLSAFKAAVARQHGPQPPQFTRINDIKRLAWLWLQFDQDPEAKRLSGRAQETGLDTWDDAAGMSELEKGMFP